MKRVARAFLKIIATAGKRFLVEGYTYRASALAFTTLLTLVPLLSVIVFLTSIFPIFNQFVKLSQDYVFANFIPTSGNVIQEYLEGFVKKAHELPAVGVLFLFVTVIVSITTIVNTLNDVWQAPKISHRKTKWLIYYSTLILAPILIGLSVFLSSTLFSLSWFATITHTLGINVYLVDVIALTINTILFSLLYIIVPNCPVNGRDGFLGGLVAAISFEIAKKAFTFYILHFPSYELIYGVMSTIPIFLMWLYISWVIVLYGALISNTSQTQKSS